MRFETMPHKISSLPLPSLFDKASQNPQTFAHPHASLYPQLPIKRRGQSKRKGKLKGSLCQTVTSGTAYQSSYS